MTTKASISLLVLLITTFFMVGAILGAYLGNNSGEKQEHHWGTAAAIQKCNRAWLHGEITREQLKECYMRAYESSRERNAGSDQQYKIVIVDNRSKTSKAERQLRIKFETENDDPVFVYGVEIGVSCFSADVSTCKEHVRKTHTSEVTVTLPKDSTRICYRFCSADFSVCNRWYCSDEIPEDVGTYVIVIYERSDHYIDLQDLKYFEWIAQYVNAIKARPDLAELARKIGNHYGCNDDLCALVATHYALTKYLNYIPDPPNEELIKSPIETLNDRGGDCEDQAILFASIARSLGFRSGLVLMVPKSEDVEGHAVSYICISPDQSRSFWEDVQEFEGMPSQYLAFEDPDYSGLCWLVDLTAKAPIGSAISLDPDDYKMFFISEDGTASIVIVNP